MKDPIGSRPFRQSLAGHGDVVDEGSSRFATIPLNLHQEAQVLLIVLGTSCPLLGR